jgi:hypothetical protein
MNPDKRLLDIDALKKIVLAPESLIKYEEYYRDITDQQYEGIMEADLVKAGKSMVDDINDRIEHEYMDTMRYESVGITAQSEASSGRKRFRTIPEE